MITPRERRILKKLAEDIYHNCGEIDLRRTKDPRTGHDYATEWLQKAVSDTFEKYKNKRGLSEGTRGMLPEVENQILDFIPEYVEKTRKDLGYEKIKKPSKLSKVDPSIITTALGVAIPVSIGFYSLFTNNLTPVDTMYSWLAYIADRLGPDSFGEIPPIDSVHFSVKFFLNGLAGGIGGFVTGLPFDARLERRKKKQYKTLHDQVKAIL